MAIELSHAYGEWSVPMEASVLTKLEKTVQDFLADEKTKMMMKFPQMLANQTMQDAPYNQPIPSEFHREGFIKDQKHRAYKEGSYAHWICLLEFLLKMTGKEIIFNAQGYNAFQDELFRMSPMHEELKFLMQGLIVSNQDQPANRQHHWVGKPQTTPIEVCVDEEGKAAKLVLVQPCALATLKDGWGIRTKKNRAGTQEEIRREVHRFAAAIHVVIPSSAIDIAADKRRRGYAHQYNLEELVERNARPSSRNNRIRQVIEGLDWSLRRLAIYARAQAEAVLRNVSTTSDVHMTVLMDATSPVSKEGAIRFQLQTMSEPLLLGTVDTQSIGFDSSVPMPVREASSQDLLQTLLAGQEGKRAIDHIVDVALSQHDAHAHAYKNAKDHAMVAGSAFQPNQNIAEGQWF